ncbi:hypothetical protein SAMN06297144_0776 [Sphingomonas guangdongensis]|uniref:Hpt domain-containing protein n=1 Tax=Sphingomonas guangdongensis TaxID=1141890 RepID=A0A285QEG8_9SPHN|nr:hypothetical protein [Sphingomonas guangdongensis]SOB79874.1 hypothetical protein SAMN06297144_0776 [Sphingomonas guangdongensis]
MAQAAWQAGGAGARADLVSRIDAVAGRLDRLGATQLLDEVDTILSLARRHNIGPAITVAHALRAAVGRGEAGAMIQGWLQILRDSVACGRGDAEARDTFAAACHLRLNG